jgi:alkylglycerol monooxygenase
LELLNFKAGSSSLFYFRNIDYAYYILIAIPIFVATIIVEFLIGKKHGKELYTFNDSITNLTIGIGNQVIGSFTKILILWLYVIINENFSLINYESKLSAFLVGTILFDFIFYWAHRWGHEINIFWGAHIVLDQSQQANLSLALRHSGVCNIMSLKYLYQ